jgi:hypothetical protein
MNFWSASGSALRTRGRSALLLGEVDARPPPVRLILARNPRDVVVVEHVYGPLRLDLQTRRLFHALHGAPIRKVLARALDRVAVLGASDGHRRAQRFRAGRTELANRQILVIAPDSPWIEIATNASSGSCARVERTGSGRCGQCLLASVDTLLLFRLLSIELCVRTLHVARDRVEKRRGQLREDAAEVRRCSFRSIFLDGDTSTDDLDHGTTSRKPRQLSNTSHYVEL